MKEVLVRFFSQALYQKAELHYQQREYEMALVFFSKGSKQRPDMKAFQEGLERTQDAINRSDSGIVLKACHEVSCS